MHESECRSGHLPKRVVAVSNLSQGGRFITTSSRTRSLPIPNKYLEAKARQVKGDLGVVFAKLPYLRTRSTLPYTVVTECKREGLTFLFNLRVYKYIRILWRG